jgi:nucleoside-diphosphate-sugar epimerase
MADVSTIVVTGASGFIGAHIVKACLEKGYNVNACVCATPALSLPPSVTRSATGLRC